MSSISITFLICLNQHDIENKSRQKLPPNTSTVVLNAEVENITLGLKDVEETPFETNTEYIIYVDKATKSLHIDYEILPKLTYIIDILFWGSVAKIITRDKKLIVNTIIKLKNTWITFTVEHKTVFDMSELILYKSHEIIFNMRLEKGANITNVPAPDNSTFYILNEDVELNCIFAELYEQVPIVDLEERTEAEGNVKLILQEILNFAVQGENISTLKLPGVNYREKILNIINWFIAKNNYECYNTYTDEGVDVHEALNATSPGRKKKNDKNSEKRQQRSNSKESYVFQLIVPGQVLFTDPSMTVFDFPNRSNDMKCAYIIVDVKNLINPVQKNILCPVIIKLNKLVNVPVDELYKQRFEYLYLTYNLCGFLRTTFAKPIAKTIFFKNHVIIFLEEKVKSFAQQAQKDYLLVKIYGIRKCLAQKESKLFGTNSQDEFFSLPMRNKKQIEKYVKPRVSVPFKEKVLVAVACFKLDPLLSTFRYFHQIENCVHPSCCPTPIPLTATENPKEPNPKLDAILNAFTINSINSRIKQTEYQSLSEDILLESGFSLVVQMELQKSIKELLEFMIQEEIFFNRIILVTGHRDLAKYVLSNVFTHNSCWIYNDDTVPPNLMPSCDLSSDLSNLNIISGFSIDNGDVFIMFLEGIAKWIKNVLWKNIKNEYFTCAKVLYNSDHIYRNRIYSGMIPYGGVYSITLHTSLKTVLGTGRIFFPGYFPEHTRRAFKKIDMILKSTCLNEITIHMLPTQKELFSLDVEWGVPVHWALEN